MPVQQMMRTYDKGVLTLATLGPWIILGACGESGSAPVGPAPPDTVVDSIWVEPSAPTIGVLGTSVWIGAAALAKDGTVLYGSTLNPGRFSWSSSAQDVAAIGSDITLSNGATVRLLTGMSEGTTTITATSQDVAGSATLTVRDNARLAWSTPLGSGSVDAGIAIGADGTIYVGANAFGGDQSQWWAVSQQGGIQWTLDLPRTWHGTPAIGDDGTLYLGTTSGSPSTGSLLAIDAGGSVRWALESIEPIRASPALGMDGTIYVAGGHVVYAVDPMGEIQWTYETEGPTFSFSSPAIASNGTIYVGGTNGTLYAIRPDGTLLWTLEGDGVIQSSPSIGPDGAIYFNSIGSSSGRLLAVEPGGNERWSVELPSRLVTSSPSIGPDGTIYVIAHGVTAVDPGGSVRWSYGCGTSPSTPILGADGTIYFTGCIPGPGGDAISALDPQGRLQWGYRTEGLIMGSPAVGADGKIIAASFTDRYEATLHAIVETNSTSGGYAGSPWPTARGNRANSGRAGG